jgi:hypothetical protein
MEDIDNFGDNFSDHDGKFNFYGDTNGYYNLQPRSFVFINEDFNTHSDGDGKGTFIGKGYSDYTGDGGVLGRSIA